MGRSIRRLVAVLGAYTAPLGWSESTIDTNGRRISSATAYLTPAVVNRPNLDILLHSQVTRLVSTDPTDATKFTAVEFVESVNREFIVTRTPCSC